ncbi:type III secretion system inner rod subunit SctI [Diaphorobacter sp. HDW4B]|uniref:type III secretion system inner rod subunit SctI n=1 Tax=Diaphorobacter sp. HDW4B TaxID=2714925 RepID=UPI00140A090D|nr:type III secretion system inner rod subunit SctI [Diaphorobacter sp. HDW4B]QIL70553.1 type III secretion system inner rod subunit SctI [Diaphorobacter sp. HDW4B]
MDIINTAAMAALSTATSTSAVGASAATAAPDALAAARFAELMALPVAPVQAPNALEATAATAALQPTTNALPANPSVGDRILQGMENVSQTFRNSWEGVNKMLDTTHADTGNVQDMLKLQMQLTQVAFEYDLVGKLVSRSTQNIDQLVRVQ